MGIKQSMWKQWLWQLPSWIWGILILLLGMMIGFLLGASGTADVDNWFITGMWPNVLTTLIASTVIYRFDRWRNEKYDSQKQDEALKDALLIQVRSSSRDSCVNAIDLMRAKGWLEGETSLLNHLKFDYPTVPQWSQANLTGASLKKARLEWGHLNGANLWGANLEEVGLSNADVSGAIMPAVILRGGWLIGAKLVETQLGRADMSWCQISGAVVTKALFDNACLDYADMRGIKANYASFFLASICDADLAGADLREACLLGARFENTIWTDDHDGPACLPDGSFYEKDEDLLRFTDPNHPQLWVPTWLHDTLGDTGLKMHQETARHFIASRKTEADKTGPLWLPSWFIDEMKKEGIDPEAL